MAELNPRDRLQPFLLDRLMDDTPGATKESREKNVMSPSQLKAALLRDLSNLLNTPGPIEAEGIAEFPNVAASVLNYGVPDLTGQTASGILGGQLERDILKAIQTFEPRLDRKSISVKITDAEGSHPNAIALEIRGQVIANPLPELLYIKSELDLESGQLSLKEKARG
ncbi:MAG TPA: type VI secretion system baseplate subunit TssE [Phycisphaerae bacterium]|jgi:type VI secretion system protein ImpF|nr:type VI secretion system baseplate subunit TssE [Phycisphaerae bacterium]